MNRWFVAILAVLLSAVPVDAGRIFHGNASPPNPLLSFMAINSANLTAARTAYLNARTSGAQMLILHDGDSTTQGHQTDGVNTNEIGTVANSYVGQLPALSLSVPQLQSSLPALGINSLAIQESYDPRIASSTWSVTQNAAIGGQSYSASTVSNELDFAAPGTTDKTDIYYVTTGSGGAATFSVNAGASLGTINGNQAAGFRKQTITYTSGSNTQKVIISSTGNVFIQGLDNYAAATGSIHHLQYGWGAVLLSQLVATTNAYSAGNAFSTFSAPLVFVNCVINEWLNSISITAMQSDMTTIGNAIVAAGGVPVFLTGNPSITSLTAQATQQSYVTAVLATAATNNWASIDTFSYFGTWALMVANGYGLDTQGVHPNTAGYGQTAILVNLFIKTYIAN